MGSTAEPRLVLAKSGLIFLALAVTSIAITAYSNVMCGLKIILFISLCVCVCVCVFFHCFY